MAWWRERLKKTNRMKTIKAHLGGCIICTCEIYWIHQHINVWVIIKQESYIWIYTAWDRSGDNASGCPVYFGRNEFCSAVKRFVPLKANTDVWIVWKVLNRCAPLISDDGHNRSWGKFPLKSKPINSEMIGMLRLSFFQITRSKSFRI